MSAAPIGSKLAERVAALTTKRRPPVGHAGPGFGRRSAPPVHVDPADLAAMLANPVAARAYVAVVETAYSHGGIVGVFLALSVAQGGGTADPDAIVEETALTARKRLQAYGIAVGHPPTKTLNQAIARWAGVDEGDDDAIYEASQSLCVEQVLGSLEILKGALGR